MTAITTRVTNRAGPSRSPHPFQGRADRQDRELLARRVAPVHDVSQLGIRELCHDLARGLSLASELARAARQHPATDELPAAAAPLAALEALLADLTDLVGQTAKASGQQLVDLRSVARAACAAASVSFGGRLELEAPSAVLVSGDAVLFQRALANVLAASCEAAPLGKVAVSLASANGSARMTVRHDGGEGLQTGLALWIAQAVMATCDGWLAWERDELGGSQTVLEVPLAVPR